MYLGYLCGDCRDNKGVSALLNHCVHCSDVNSALIVGLCKTLNYLYIHKQLTVVINLIFFMLICFAVIVDAVLIIALLYKDVMFSALFFPTVFFINVRKICCGIVTYINVCMHCKYVDGFLCWRKLSYFLLSNWKIC